MKSAIEIRLYMASLGWNSDDRLTSTGWGKDENGNPKFGYSIWFERWNWHGKQCAANKYHAHTDNLSKIDQITQIAADIALKAWANFTEPGWQPNQLADGTLVENYVRRSFGVVETKLVADELDDFPPEPCRTPNCPDTRARYGSFCGDCLNLRRERYSELVPNNPLLLPWRSRRSIS